MRAVTMYSPPLCPMLPPPLPLDTAAVAGTSFVGRLLALMGPSGSGKTSLLNALASHVPANSGMKLTGVRLMVWGLGLKFWG